MESTETVDLSPEEIVFSDHSTVADQVYRRYQHTRGYERAACIDAILERIQEAQEVSSTSADFNESVTDKLLMDKDSQDTNTERSWLGSLSYRLLGRLQPSVPRLGIALSVAAIGLFTAVVLLQPPRDSQFDHATLVNFGVHSARLVDYLDKYDAQSLGFASRYTSEKSAFRRGLLATDLAIAVHAQDRAAQRQVLERIADVASEEGLTALKEEAGSLVRVLTSSVLADSTLPNQGEGDEYEESETGPSLQIEEMVRRLRTPSLDSGHTGWFEQGYALQAVAVAAQLQLGTGISQPLVDSLQYYRNLDVPEQGLAASKLLETLKDLSEGPKADAASVRSIIATTRDIKIVMQ